ncbi:FG-GAP-like repeat-containing protein [Winogradskyella thalassocola]|uniref:Por secretion system C-terminal sorting domain-containing protein n=1 Tax=Winogradskyella thalassocola TaxID=262004 RepID=A0A1G8HSS3_9FLAO|nr:FG-GAP-like repeat-containing protein [Winogradskyella thalassocola]SDI09703.1 Por secretion system C-terminal sorting domain-containing protein [Winogradskyella thalassocola]
MIKKLHNKQLSVILGFIVIFIIQNGYAQVFNHVENTVGLSVLQENNGVAVADYDGDNDLDIFVVAKAKDDPSRPKTLSRLFQNNNDGSFTDVTEVAGFINLLSQDEGGSGYFGLDGNKSGAFWGDFNNDGYPDLFLTNSLKVQLWKNMGNGTFSNITTSAGFQPTNLCRYTGATWFDYNNDGFLDIYINDWNGCGSNQLYKNNGDDTFTDVTVLTGLFTSIGRPSYTALPFDFNDDGFMDLLVTNDLSKANYLYINNNGTTFTDSALAYGANTMGDDMGITISDYNSDGNFDIFITTIDQNFFLHNNGDNTFTERVSDFDFFNTGWSWGAKFSDFDLDGDEDLFIVNGFDFGNRDAEPNFYYRSSFVQGEDKFEDVSSQLGLNEVATSVEVIDWDYDNDGDIDLFVTNSDRPSYLYENKTLSFDITNTEVHFFKIKLEGTISNRDAIGTTLTLTTENGSLKRYNSGVGVLSQSSQAVHFGLGDVTDIISLEIKWPSGLIETFNDLNADTTIKATEGQGYEVLNIIPSQKIYGCIDPLSCSYNPDATLPDNSCTYLESNAIIGNLSSSFLQTEVYTCNIGNESIANWQVVGGEILSGQGTNTITVKWHLEESGSISVIEISEQCNSLPTSVQVSLGIDNLPEDISIARLWNEALLEAIRRDYARPTIHARNLFHSSVAMYDIWAIYDDVAAPYLIGNTVHGFSSTLEDFSPSASIEDSEKEAISFAMYRLLTHRFQNSPNIEVTQARFDLIMDKLGYNTTYTSLLYENGRAAALGNFVGQTLIDYGLQDGSREATGYNNGYYEPVNAPYALDLFYHPPINDPNRWEPLSLETYIDQSGNLIDGSVPPFLSPEWGNVSSFALTDEDRTTYERDGNLFNVYHDPSNPPYISTTENTSESEAYKWGFSMVSVWQSHLDPSDNVMWDISPSSIGNVDISTFPTSYDDYPDFYNFTEGGSNSNGHAINPYTGNPYEANIVPRGDYTRVLAEFWADGPDSETPPGHWFSLLNYVSDHQAFEKRFKGEGEILDPLEWDVKSYFILGGGMHDAAISAWSIKGWYDYIRPISALRYMAEQGQSTDPSLINYSVSGIELIDGYIEVVDEEDPLAGFLNLDVGKIKVYTWKGHDYISNTETDQAGVGWILAENWYPYQRPTFVTPPFAGFVSGHSTYSRAAAELITMITGDEYFPGGIGEFVAKKNEFLVFEEGPSQDVVLQWATYRDASDQTSLSRIWGGIHPPADDIPGRFIGQVVAEDTFSFAVPYFEGEILHVDEVAAKIGVYPNPTTNRELNISNTNTNDVIAVYDMRGRKIEIQNRRYDALTNTTTIKLTSAETGLYLLKVNANSKMIVVNN